MMRYCALLVLASLGLVGGPWADAAENRQVRLTALGSMERIGLDQQPHGLPEVKIQAAKNEWESFQVVVSAAGENILVTSAEITGLAGPGGAAIPGENITLYREEYTRVRMSTPRAELPPGLYADPLVPFINPITGEPIEPRRRIQERWGGPSTERGYDMYAVPFEVFRGQNQTIWVDVHVPKDAPAGDYKGALRVRTRGQGAIELPVALTVWDFAIPDRPTHRNHFGSFRTVGRYFNAEPGSDKFREIEMRYCRAMAEHRLNPPIPDYLLPEVNKDGSLTISPERHEALKKYLAELHVADFEIPRAPFARLSVAATGPEYKQVSPDERAKAQRYYRAYYDYLKRSGWEKDAYVYLWDEPNIPENYEQVLVLGQIVHEAVPELKCLVVEQTYPHEPSWADIDPAVDIWCALWAFIDRGTIERKIAGGDEVWSYTALVQRAPRYHPQYEQVKDLDPPYWHIDRPLIVYRVPTWINRQYGITGLLYWSTVTAVIDPWNNPAFAHPGHFNGGGYLFYPGTPCGIDGPVASIRLKVLRDGMEDYEYFTILRERSGDPAVKRLVDKIAPNWWDYCRDPRVLLDVRRELAEAIQRAGADPNK